MVIIKKKKTDCLNSFSSVRILKTENENDKIHCGGLFYRADPLSRAGSRARR